MNDIAMTLLNKLGHDVSAMPVIRPCRGTGDDHQLYFLHDLLTGFFQVGCGCGHSGDEVSNPVHAITSWNAVQSVIDHAARKLGRSYITLPAGLINGDQDA